MKAVEKNLWVYNPIWRKNQEEYMMMLLRMGFKFIITRITSMGIPMDLLGKPIEENDVIRLNKLSRKYGFNPAFEGGEAETLVLDTPLMKKEIIVKGEPVIKSKWEGEFLIKKAFLKNKIKNH